MLRVLIVAAAAMQACAFAPGALRAPGAVRPAHQKSLAAFRSQRVAAAPSLGLSMQKTGQSAQPSPITDVIDKITNLVAGSTEFDPQAVKGRGVVITGSAGGVGYAYADKFLEYGLKVVLCDISPKVSEAEAALKAKHEGAQVFSTVCDVSDKQSVEALASFAQDKLGTIHYWINNAGINGGRVEFMDVPIDQVEAVVKVNLLGALVCTHYAMRLMSSQPGVTSHIFNTVGSGVKGGGTPGYVCYGATKRGQPQMTASLAAELSKGVQGYEKKEYAGDVRVHTISPGMVFTQLLLDQSTPELRKFPFGVLAAQPEEVAEDLIPKVLSTSGQGTSVEYLTTDKVLTKFYQRFILGEKSKYIDDDGNVIQKPGQEYDAIGVRKLF